MMRRYWHLLLLLAAATVLSMACSLAALPRAGQAEHGRLDLGYRADLVAVHGQWEFYPGTLLFPLDFEQQGTPVARSAAPAPERLESAAHGYATYRLSLSSPSSAGYRGIIVPNLGSAAALWVDGKKVGEAGQVGRTANEEIPSSNGITALYRQPTDSADVVLQVSDFHHGSAGRVRAPVLYGSAQSILGYESVVRGLELALLVFLAIVAALFFIRALGAPAGRTRGGSFGVAGLCLAAIFRLLLLPGMPGLPAAVALLGDLSWAISLRLEVFSFFVMLAAYFVSLLRRAPVPSGLTAVRILTGASILVALGSLFVPASTHFLIVAVAGSLLALGVVGVAVWSVLAATREGRGGLVAFASAEGIILAVAAVNDLLVYLGYSSIGYLGPLAAAFFGVLAWFETASTNMSYREAGGKGLPAELDIVLEDLGRPLRSIVTLAESLLSVKMGDLNDEQVVSLSLIAASGLRLANGVADLADRDRLSREELELELTAVSIEPLVDRVSDYLKPLLLVRSVQIKNDLPRDLPPVRGDRRRIEQIIYNVLSQGLRHRERGELTVSARARGEVVELEVTAGGAAIASEAPSDVEAPSEFDNFRMEVASQLVRLHGGRMTASGLENGGSLDIRFTLPIAEDAAPAEISEQLIQFDKLDPAAHGEGNGDDRVDARFEILLGDSDLVSLQTMRNYLVKQHYKVRTAFDGEEVLRLVDEGRPDLLLIDASLPGVDGMEVCRRVRKSYATSELPILVVVDKDQLSSLTEGMNAGASDFISKPILRDEFLARVQTHINLAKMNQLYSRFVPVELLHFLGHQNVTELKLGDQIQREMTILFVDIRSFTNLSEGMSPEENFKFINSYLARITPIIRENNGFIDKYIGDAILALYPGSPEDALRSAIRMVDYLQEYNGYRRNSGYRPINIGIGIHTGNLIVGIIGDADRMQGTVISDAVNLASRVQDVTKVYGANIIISQDTFVQLDNPTIYNFRFLGRVKVKGKNQTVSLFEVFDGESPERVALKNRTKQEFEEAILHFSQRKFAEAMDSFRRISLQNPDDRAAQLFLNRSEFFLKREKANWLLK